MKKQILTKLIKLNNQKERLEKQIDNVKKHIIWKCLHCNKGTQIRFLDLIVIKYYIPPSGCVDGAYWTEGTNPEYNILCPKCSQVVRVYKSTFDNTLSKLWELTHSLRSSFKSETVKYR